MFKTLAGNGFQTLQTGESFCCCASWPAGPRDACIETERRQENCLLLNQEVIYRDEINHSEKPTQIESDFAAFEGEAAEIIKDYFLDSREINLPAEKDDALKLFSKTISSCEYSGKKAMLLRVLVLIPGATWAY